MNATTERDTTVIPRLTAKMCIRDRPRSTPPEPIDERIQDIDLSSEMQGSFLEYAYSVIYSRALPDARDGLKPVQRRICLLYTSRCV